MSDIQLFVQHTEGLSLIPVPDFKAVEEYRDSGNLSVLAVEFAGVFMSVDLRSGSLSVGEHRFEYGGDASLVFRPIYYKQMFWNNLYGQGIEFIALGWQATCEGSNLRWGIKLYPMESKYEICESL